MANSTSVEPRCLLFMPAFRLMTLKPSAAAALVVDVAHGRARAHVHVQAEALAHQRAQVEDGLVLVAADLDRHRLGVAARALARDDDVAVREPREDGRPAVFGRAADDE